MRVLCTNACGWGFKHLYRDFPGKVGWLISPGSWKSPYPGLFYALDNGAFSAWINHTPWDLAGWLKILDKAAKFHRPSWAIVPDAVGDRAATLASWLRWAPEVQQRGIPTAFAVQDGMTRADVPQCDVVFIGGTTQWKWKTLPYWVKHFPRVHVGRVRQEKLMICAEFGVESVDGTGWFREGQDGKPVRFLRSFLSGSIEPHPRLWHTLTGVNNL